MAESNRDESSGSIKEIERREFARRWAFRLAVLIVLALLSVGGYRGYGELRKRNLAQQLQRFVERGEYQSAVLVARRLLELDEHNLTAAQAMAEMAERSGRAEAVTWRQRIAHQQPRVTAHALALAKSALRFGQHGLAEDVLAKLPETARSSALYHQLTGTLALAQQDRTKAETEFAAALRFEPHNAQLALNLAALQLSSRDPAILEEARARLAALAAKTEVRLPALRALSADALARGRRAEAQNWTTQLRTHEGAEFADELLHFQAMEGTGSAPQALEDLKTKASANAATTAELITWLNRHGMAASAAAWALQLPPEILDTQPVPLAVAESYSFLQDWTALRDWVEGKDWGRYEALRLAVESHAFHRLSPPDRPSMQTQSLWRAALKAAQARPEQVIAIAQLAEGWGYRSDAEEAWWIVANSGANPKPGLSALQRLYKAQQDTRGLLRVAKRALELNPGDLVAANNCASLGLLLTADSAARRLAAKLHAAHPANRAFATTYAYALHTEGKFAEALKLIESLKEAELQHPAIAAYYVVMLTDNGQLERARSFLPHAKRAALLPEEQQLLTAATRKLLADDHGNGVAKK